MRLTILALLVALTLAPTVDAEPHWSFRPRSRPPVPALTDAEWVRNDLDAFILQRLRKQKLPPAAEADRVTLIRRLTFDLIGLPPTPEQIDAFVRDPADDAYEKLVERLLASPHHGERWAQHWLDVVRYAESDGFEYDRYRPGLWRYRDYVIQSFNEDKPFDRFVREQIAGDEIDAGDQTLQVAVGFHRLGPVRRNAGNQDVAFSRNEVLTEMTDAVGLVFLGLTVGCARCHDHKFDDFSQEDYYRLQAFFAAVQEHSIVLADEKTEADWKARYERTQEEIKQLKLELGRADDEKREQVRARLRKVERELPSPLPAVCTVHNVEAERTPIHVLKRGLPEKPGTRVTAAFPTALAAGATPDEKKPRTALARWLTDPAHPLTARVIVNRVWQYHFGRGLVETPNDFGLNGAVPSHPELLDWLADEFVRGGWRLRSLHRLIVLSSTYRQASKPSLDGRTKDPDNRLLSWFPRRRLSAEEVRDAMLSIAGRLNLKAGGESVVVPVEKDLVDLLYDPAQWTVTADEKEHDRRSIYLLAKRNLRHPFGQVFDQPDLQTSCPRREVSTHALQALELLNGRTANRLAEAFATRLEREAERDSGRQVELAYRLATGRLPTPHEKELAQQFLQKQPLREFALAVFNLNAFLYAE